MSTVVSEKLKLLSGEGVKVNYYGQFRFSITGKLSYVGNNVWKVSRDAFDTCVHFSENQVAVVEEDRILLS